MTVIEYFTAEGGDRQGAVRPGLVGRHDDREGRSKMIAGTMLNQPPHQLAICAWQGLVGHLLVPDILLRFVKAPDVQVGKPTCGLR